MPTINKSILIALFLSFLATSCGYYNPYVADRGTKPITLHRSLWNNQTNELGLESSLYHTLSDWLRRSNMITLTEKENDAKYVMSGEITRIDYSEISYNSFRVANELRAKLSVSFKVKELATGKTIWEKSNYTLEETLLTDSNPAQLQYNKKTALAEISNNLSEEIYLYIINNFIRPNNYNQHLQRETEVK